MLAELFGNILTVSIAGTGAVIMIAIAIRAVRVIAMRERQERHDEQNRPS